MSSSWTTNYTLPVGVQFNRSIGALPFTCERVGGDVTSKGVFFNGIHPMRSPFPFLISQLAVTVILTAVFRRLLRPLKQPRFVAEMLAGFMLSPSVLGLFGKADFISGFMTNKESNIMDSLETLGLATISFVVGIRTDMSVIKTAGKMSWIIGILSFVLPFSIVLLAVEFIKKYDPLTGFFLYWAAIYISSTAFQVTSFLLEDLNLVNSEIGRLAMSSALICSLCSWVFTIYNSFFTFARATNFGLNEYIKTQIPRFIIILVIIFCLRPFMFWMMRKIPEGKSIKESHFFVMIVMFFTVAFVCESLGYQTYFGGMILGLAVPPGPPLGSGVVQKLDFLVSTVFVPAYIVGVGRYVDVYQVSMATFCVTEIVILLAYLGKLAGAVLPSVICKMPYKDSCTLGLVLSSQGFFNVLFFKLYMRFSLIPQGMFTVLIVSVVLIEAVISPLIFYLYDPSKRYLSYRRRTIQQSSHENELKILLCLYEEDQVFSLMNVLKASHPTRERPIGAFVLDLIELVGRDHPLLINHQFHERRSSTLTRTDRIISAFNQYELSSEGSIKHQHYTTITPYVTMHDDICSLALEKSTSLLIIPFQKSDNTSIRGVIKNVIDKAPCSVGILVDKKIITYWRSDSQKNAQFHVCLVFFGGADSREALAYGMRMVENPSTQLTVIRLIAEDEFISDLLETQLDIKAIHDLRALYEDNQRIEYREVIVKDGVETSGLLLSLDDHYDFMLVGRRLDSDSPLVAGLADWSYAQELGIIGDMLASSDMKCRASVLVLQQQSTVNDLAQKP